MSQQVEAQDRDIMDWVFGPATSAQTYLNLVYLLLSFPLGLAYFIFLTFAISLGTGLLIVFVGVPILIGMLAACLGLGAFERQMARSMLHIAIPAPPAALPRAGFWEKAKAMFGNPATWKSFGYLMLKFPFGIAMFVLLVTTLSVSISMVLAPLIYRVVPLDFIFWRVDTGDEAAMWCLAGGALLIGSLHMSNGLAQLWGRFAQFMLGPD